ncbi:MAG: thioredoxin family protein [Phycisphaerales bacterium]|nr:MAG: thioredoxin family protein [Phycisphaerales bacterium]
MDKTIKIIIVVALLSAVVVAVAVRKNRAGAQEMPEEYKPENLLGKGLPTLVDLGSDTCVSCKMMISVIDELRTQYAGRLQVNFLDVHEYPDLISLYGVTIIPTQIFYDGSGKELFRHEGFYPTDDILAKWKELGVELAAAK